MKKCMAFIIMAAVLCGIAGTAYGAGDMVTSELWIRAVINTVDSGDIEAVWKKGGEDTTAAGDHVIWGYFHASPDDVSWGNQQNPDLFVKIWFDRNGRVDVNFFHVSVPNIEVYSDYPYDGVPDEQGTTTLSARYIRQYYENGQSDTEKQNEDGEATSDYLPIGSPSGYIPTQNLRIGTLISTVEKGLIDGLWKKGGEDSIDGGHRVLWGHFYANPDDVAWGNADNPDLFVKVWFDAGGRVDVNFFHVSVPNIEVYSDIPISGVYNQKGTTILNNRYIRHEYQTTGEPNDPPIAKFTAILSSDTIPLTVTLDASESYDPDGNIVKYQWANSEDPGNIKEGKITELTLPNEGTYTFTLTVTDDSGFQDMLQQTAEIKWPGTGTGEFEATEFVLTTDIPPEECKTPASSETAFSDKDRTIIAWANYRNFDAGKSYKFVWRNPDGDIVQEDEGTRNDLVAGCSWVSISAAKLQEYEPGEWIVEFYYDGEKQKEKFFTFTSAVWGTDFNVTEFVFTSKTPASECEKPASQLYFSDSDPKVTAWARYIHFEKDKTYEFRWYNPNGILAQKNRGEYKEDVVGGCAWISISAETVREYGSGRWKVEFYYDGQIYREEHFTFTSDHPGTEFEVTEARLTNQSPGDDCDNPPTSQTAFAVSDQNVTAWISYRNIGISNENYEFRWYNPGGRTDSEPAQTNRGTYRNDAVSGCSYASIPTETLALYDPGEWTVEFYRDDQQYWKGYFTFDYATPFEVTEFRLTTESPRDECEELISSGTSFDDNDSDVFARADYFYAKAGKEYEFRWYAPENTLAQKNTSSYSADVRTGCSWFSISSERLQEYASGQWRVEFYHDGQKYAEKAFTFTSTRPDTFELTEFLFTDEYENSEGDCQQPASRTAFNENDAKVIAYVYYRNFEGGKNYEFRWYSPTGVLALTTEGTSRAEDVSRGCSWPGISTGKLREYGSGQWRVVFYYDDRQYGEKTFSFTSSQPGKDFEVTKFLFSKESSQSQAECKEPASAVVFDDDDSSVLAWLYYRNFKSGDKLYEFKWYNPEGVLAQTDKGSVSNALGGGCLWADISREKLQGYKSGQWRVQFYYEDQLYKEEAFTFSSEHSDTAYEVTDFAFTRDQYSNEANCKKPSSDTSFSADDSKVTAWVQFRNLKSGKDYIFKWYSPQDLLIQTNMESASQDISRGCVWVDLSTEAIKIRPPGQWRVEFHYDAQRHHVGYFTFD